MTLPQAFNKLVKEGPFIVDGKRCDWMELDGRRHLKIGRRIHLIYIHPSDVEGRKKSQPPPQRLSRRLEWVEEALEMKAAGKSNTHIMRTLEISYEKLREALDLFHTSVAQV